MPNLFVIAGPNGAGKSTSAPELLTGARRVDEFVNADVIASERCVSDIEAGRITLRRLTELAKERRDMAFETTLSSHLLLTRIRAMQQAGYLFHLVFFWIPDADLAVQRVAARVLGLLQMGVRARGPRAGGLAGPGAIGRRVEVGIDASLGGGRKGRDQGLAARRAELYLKQPGIRSQAFHEVRLRRERRFAKSSFQRRCQVRTADRNTVVQTKRCARISAAGIDAINFQ